MRRRSLLLALFALSAVLLNACASAGGGALSDTSSRDTGGGKSQAFEGAAPIAAPADMTSRRW